MWVALIVAAVVMVFAAGLLLTIYTVAPGGARGVLAGDRIAVVPLRGVITEGHPALRQLRELRDDSSIRGFVLWIDSPGGEVAPSQALYREVRRLRSEGVPVVAAIGSVGTSGAYYAALGADTIVALPGSLIGSIGVLMEYPIAEALLDRVGVRFEVIKSAEHKDVGSPYREATEGDRELLQAVVDDVFAQFVDAVAEERGLPRDSVERISDGRLLSGRLALDYGLIDAEGDLVDAIATAGTMAGLGPEPRTLMREERPVGWTDLFSSAVGWLAAREAATSLRDLLLDGGISRGPRLLYQLRP